MSGDVLNGRPSLARSAWCTGHEGLAKTMSQYWLESCRAEWTVRLASRLSNRKRRNEIFAMPIGTFIGFNLVSVRVDDNDENDSLSQLTRTPSLQSNQITRTAPYVDVFIDRLFFLVIIIIVVHVCRRNRATRETLGHAIHWHFLFSREMDDNDRYSMGTQQAHVHEHEQFNFLIRFFPSLSLTTRLPSN